MKGLVASLAATAGLILSFTLQEHSRDGPEKKEVPQEVEVSPEKQEKEIPSEKGGKDPPESEEEAQPKPSDKDLQEFRSRLVSIQEALESQREILSEIQESQNARISPEEDSRIQDLIEKTRVLKYAVDGIYDRLESQDYEALERAMVQIAGRVDALIEETEGREPGISSDDLVKLETRLEERFKEILAKISKTQSQELAKKPQEEQEQQEQRKEDKEPELWEQKGYGSYEEFENHMLKPPGHKDHEDRREDIVVYHPEKGWSIIRQIWTREVDDNFFIFYSEDEGEWQILPPEKFHFINRN